jgi:hypothetical protein
MPTTPSRRRVAAIRYAHKLRCRAQGRSGQRARKHSCFDRRLRAVYSRIDPGESNTEIAAGLIDFARAGASQFILSAWPKSESMQFFGTEVLPRVRRLEGRL